MPKEGMSDIDLTNDEGGLPADVAKAIEGADRVAAGPGSEKLLEEDEDTEVVTGEQPGDEGDESDDDGQSVPQTVPFKQFSRVYAEGKEAKKAAKQIADENAALKAKLAQLENGGATRQPVQPGKATAAQIIERVAAEAAKKAAAPLETMSKVAEAKEMLDEFWAENQDPELLAHKKAVDKAIIGGVKSGAYELEDLDPEIILATMVGRGHLNTRRATKAAAASSARKVTESNKNARAERGPRASGDNANKKKFSEKSVAEIEAEFGNTPIYRRRAPEDDDVDAE